MIICFIQGIMFVNNSNGKLKWSLDLEKGGPCLDDGTFQFLHRSGSPYNRGMQSKNETIPTRLLDSGETSQLGVLFTPGNLLALFCFCLLFAYYFHI